MRGGGVLQAAATLMASGAMLGFAASYLVPPRFVAGAALSTTLLHPQPLFQDAWSKTLSQESLVPIIVESLSYKPKLDLIPMEDLLRHIRDGSVMTSAELPGGVTRFTIEFVDDDRDAALEIARELLLGISDNAIRLKHADGASEVAQVVDPPRVRETGPARALFTGIGVAGGLLIAAALWLAAARS